MRSPSGNDAGVLATRYDKLAIAYRYAAGLSACINWTRPMADTT